MIKKASIIISVLIVITLVILLVLQNSDRVNFTLLLPAWRVEGLNAGVLVIIAFSTGFLCASFLAAAYSLRGLWRELGLVKKDKRREDFIQMLTLARSASAVGNWDDAKTGWEKVLKRDPENILAKLEIARALRKTGKQAESLALIEELRRENNDNPEVLLSAIELNQSMGNKTAALDNALLLLKQQNSAKILKIARDLSQELGRYSQAIDFHKKLAQLESDPEYGSKLANLEFQLLLAEEEKSEPSKLRDRLRSFTASHSESALALMKLAELEIQLGNTEEGAQAYARAGKASECPGFWKKAIQVWLDASNPSKALSAAKTACKSATGKGRLYAEIYMIRTQVALNMLDDAKSSLDGFQKLAEDQKSQITPELAQQYLALKGLVYARQGLIKESTDIWKQLSELDFSLSQESTHPVDSSKKKQPAPELSTP